MSFESYVKERNSINGNKSIFIFWFNVLSHIDIKLVTNCFIEGDVIINSLWGNKEQDINIRNKYYATFDDRSNQCQSVLQAAKTSKSVNDIGISFKAMNCLYTSPNFFEVAYV